MGCQNNSMGHQFYLVMHVTCKVWCWVFLYDMHWAWRET